MSGMFGNFKMLARAAVPSGKTQAVSLGVPQSRLRNPNFKEFGAADLVGSREG